MIIKKIVRKLMAFPTCSINCGIFYYSVSVVILDIIQVTPIADNITYNRLLLVVSDGNSLFSIYERILCSFSVFVLHL